MYNFNHEPVESGLFTVKASVLSIAKDNSICSIPIYLLYNSLSVNLRLVLDIIPA